MQFNRRFLLYCTFLPNTVPLWMIFMFSNRSDQARAQHSSSLFLTWITLFLCASIFVTLTFSFILYPKRDILFTRTGCVPNVSSITNWSWDCNTLSISCSNLSTVKDDLLVNGSSFGQSSSGLSNVTLTRSLGGICSAILSILDWDITFRVSRVFGKFLTSKSRILSL